MTNFTSSETRRIVLPDSENHTIVSSFVCPQHPNVSDRQTDRQNCSGYYSALHSSIKAKDASGYQNEKIIVIVKVK